jgi:hypothetical protein
MSEFVWPKDRLEPPSTTENGSRGETREKDVRYIFEGHATEGGYSTRCWSRLLSAVLIGDSIEMYGF